jgi:hypothetical protein
MVSHNAWLDLSIVLANAALYDVNNSFERICIRRVSGEDARVGPDRPSGQHGSAEDRFRLALDRLQCCSCDRVEVLYEPPAGCVHRDQVWAWGPPGSSARRVQQCVNAVRNESRATIPEADVSVGQIVLQHVVRRLFPRVRPLDPRGEDGVDKRRFVAVWRVSEIG